MLHSPRRADGYAGSHATGWPSSLSRWRRSSSRRTATAGVNVLWVTVESPMWLILTIIFFMDYSSACCCAVDGASHARIQCCGAAAADGRLYTASSRLQAAGLRPAIKLFEEAAAVVPLPRPPQPIVIADYGASTGHNSLPVGAAIAVLRKRTRPEHPRWWPIPMCPRTTSPCCSRRWRTTRTPICAGMRRASPRRSGGRSTHRSCRPTA